MHAKISPRILRNRFGYALSVAVVVAAAYNESTYAQCLSDGTRLLASDGTSADNAGAAVAISGGVAVVGAPGDSPNGSDSGSVYVYRQSGGRWAQEQKLVGSATASSSKFGASVSVSGDVIAVGASGQGSVGAVYVYRFDGSSWREEQILQPSDGASGDKFGWVVSASGDAVLVGAYGVDDLGTSAGAAYVFRFNGSSWRQEQKLHAWDAAASDFFGVAAALSGDVAVVGAYLDDDHGTSSGSAYVFRFNGSSWVADGKIVPNDVGADDRFGQVLAVSGDTIVAGLPRDDDVGTDAGAAYVFVDTGSGWSQQAKLKATSGNAYDSLGTSVGISGDKIIAGAPGYDRASASDSGIAYLFVRSGSSWSQRSVVAASDPWNGDEFGTATAIDGDAMFIGVALDDNLGNNSGSVYEFQYLCADTGCTSNADCDDGLYCNGAERCVSGSCQAGSAPCGAGLCNESSNACVECLSNGDCDDGLYCNGTERCVSGSCQVGSAPCGAGLCNESSNACVECLSNSDCDDGLYCNGAERCVSGSCQAGSAPCGAGLCNESSNACVECLSNGDCDDGLYCNGAERCVSGSCQAGSAPCGTGLCNESLDACVECLSTNDCDDGNPCTTDSCIGNVCQHGSVADCCLTHADCDDSDSCTDDRCYLNRCVHQEICECRVNADCDDGVYCNGAELCINNACVAGAAPCSGSLCNEASDACVECLTGADCGDGNPCTNDACIGGSCTHSAIANCCTSHSQCDDGDACTDDRCVLNRCQSQNVCECQSNADCNDGDVCTADACVSNACSYVPISNCCTSNGDCNDGDACTDDVCAANRCQHVDVCECQFNAECDDADPCTNDTCLNNACKHSSIAECCTSNGDCDDGDACTADRCVLNRCQNTDTCECRQDGDCDDGNVCTNDACVGNVCVFSAINGCCNSAAECDDGDSCTLDLCVSAQCQHTQECECASNIDCDDGDPCTSDQCVGGVCQHTGSCSGCASSAECNDNNPCTTDVCTGGVCSYEAVSGCCTTSSQCDDGDECTTDTCVDHVCVNVASCACHVSSDCDDGDPCTDDTCDAGVCLNAPNHVCEALRPAIVTVTATFAELVGQIAVEWGEPVEGVEYLVYRCDNEDIASCTARTDWMAGTSFVDEDVEPGKIYWYRVRGRNEYGESDYSLPTSGSALPAAAPNGGDSTSADSGGTQNSEVTNGGDAGCTGPDCQSGTSPGTSNNGSGGVSNPCGALGGSLAFMLMGLSMLRFARPKRRGQITRA